MSEPATCAPDWALIEAAKRAGIKDARTQYLRGIYDRSGSSFEAAFCALADLIAAHKTPPVDEDRDALIDVFQAAGLGLDWCTPAEFEAAKAVIRKIDRAIDHATMPEAVRIAEEVASSTSYKPDSTNYARVYQAAYRAATLVIDRALRPATMPGDALDWRRIAKAAGDHGVRYRTNSALLQFVADSGLTAMQPAIQAAVDALEKIKAMGLRNEQFSSDRAVWAKMASIAGDSLATLRTVTEQGEG